MNEKKIIAPNRDPLTVSQRTIDALSSEEEKAAFLQEQVKKLAKAYPATALLMAWKKALPNQYKEGASIQVDRALKELQLAGYLDAPNSLDDMIAHDVLELMALLSAQGHTGQSVSAVVNLLRHLASGNILTPLTGEDSEWEPLQNTPDQPSTTEIIHNKRHQSVFKNVSDGTAYCVDAIIFRDRNLQGQFLRGGMPGDGEITSSVQVVFPCIPKQFVLDVDVVFSEKVDYNDSSTVETITNIDQEQLARIKEYYSKPFEGGK